MLNANDIYYNTIQMVNAYAATNNNAIDNWHIQIADKTVQDPRSIIAGYIPDTFYQYAAKILLDCLETFDKTRFGSVQISALKRVIKNAKKYNINAPQGIFPESNNLWLTDSFRLFRLSSDLPSLPHFDETQHTILPAGKIYFPTMDAATIPVDLPNVPALKVWIREQEQKNGKRRGLWDCLSYNLDGVYVNAEYLLDVLEACPSCQMYRQESNVSPLFFKAKDESISGVICPVKPPVDASGAA